MATEPGYIQVATDGTGKKMRTEVDSIRQPDGSYSDVHREIVSPPEEWNESNRDEYVRQTGESILNELRQITRLLSTIAGGLTTPQGNPIDYDRRV